MERSLDGDSAGVLIPSIVISSNGQFVFLTHLCVLANVRDSESLEGEFDANRRLDGYKVCSNYLFASTL